MTKPSVVARESQHTQRRNRGTLGNHCPLHPLERFFSNEKCDMCSFVAKHEDLAIAEWERNALGREGNKQ